jgi:hypothetical protein
MSKNILLATIVTLLSACGSLGQKYDKLNLGSTRSEVAQTMGAAPYSFTYENVDAWRYAVIAGFGYCDYREFYIYRDVLIYKNEYRRASIAGCTVGLKDITWEPILAVAQEYDEEHPISKTSQTSKNVVEQLKELELLRERGALTQEEYMKAKKSVLNGP